MAVGESSELLNAMRALHAALEQHDAAISAAHGIGRSDWRCLQMLAHEGPQSPGNLQRALGLTSGSVTALLDRLEKRGFLKRRRHATDRRGVVVEACGAGHDVLTNAGTPLYGITQKLADRWGEERVGASARTCLDLARLVEWASKTV